MQIEFYKIVSQIITILFLAVSLQSVFISKRERYKGSENFQRIHILAFTDLVAILLLGEFVSMRNIYTNTSSFYDLPVVTTVMAIAVLWITADFVLALLNRTKELHSRIRTPWRQFSP